MRCLVSAPLAVVAAVLIVVSGCDEQRSEPAADQAKPAAPAGDIAKPAPGSSQPSAPGAKPSSPTSTTAIDEKRPVPGGSVGAYSLIDNLPLPAAASSSPDAVEPLIREGRALEAAGKPAAALAKYQEAEAKDPADAVVQIHLGEYHRHHGGDWSKARQYFEKAWGNPGATAEIRATAMHGLGKMEIWIGDAAKGLGLLEASLRLCPTVLDCRDLATYWFSEKDGQVKAVGFAKQAVEMAPDDAFTKVFYAGYLAFLGRKDEIAKLIPEKPGDPSQRYNYAVISAELGDNDKALEHLRAYFGEYETNDQIRGREMEEARSDYHFRGLCADPRFLELTALGAHPAGKPQPFWLAKPDGEPTPAVKPDAAPAQPAQPAQPGK